MKVGQVPGKTLDSKFFFSHDIEQCGRVFVRLSYSAFKIKKLTLKMAEKKDTDTPESLGYEKEIDQSKADLALARRQVNF